jgi:putative N6-adenine-specific DNA methylase
MELIAPCLFGLETILKQEIIDLGYEITEVADGRVTFEGDEEALCRANVFLRSTERIMIKVGSFKAETFDELFENTKKLEWENYIPKDGRFWVTKASSIRSTLFSASDIQSIVKKAIVERLKRTYRTEWFDESGSNYPMRVFILKDIVTIALDSTGDSLHKRGYRQLTSRAPISETLAASIIQFSPWNKDRILVDPFCGSGTFAIEAAMMGANIAPGMNREFTAENWTNIIKKKTWFSVIDEANDLIDENVDMDIQAYDIDPEMIKIARENAKSAGVEKFIHFQQRPVSKLSHPKKYGFIITNPPYGERLETEDTLPAIYKELGDAFKRLDSWSMYVISSYEGAERHIGKKSDKTRKIYNGMLKSYLYQFHGPKPPRKKNEV